MRRIYRWVRANGLAILNVTKVVLVGIILMLVVNIQISNAHQAQATRELAASTKHIADQIKEAVKDENANTNAQLAEANAHLDCIARFFAQPNRTSASIVDLNQCSIVHTGSGASSQSAGTIKQSDNTMSFTLPQPAGPAQQTSPIAQQPSVNPQPQPSGLQDFLNSVVLQANSVVSQLLTGVLK